jgi:hypothetical protein
VRPRKLDTEREDLLVAMFDKVKSDMRGRSNQFQVAEKLKSHFRVAGAEQAYSLEEANRRWASLEAVAEYFGLPHYLFTNGLDSGLHLYIRWATPAAIVQMVKRIKFRYKTLGS